MSSEKGVTLVEVMIAISVLAIAVAGTISAVQTSNMSNTISREHARAAEAAQAMIAEIRAESFNQIVSRYENTTFNVDFYPEQRRAGAPRMGIGGAAEGEVVIVRDENPSRFNYGRDLDGDGTPDGVDLGTVWGSGLDLDASGGIDAAGVTIAPGALQVIPVYVIVRWQTVGGPLTGRVQLCTFIANAE